MKPKPAHLGPQYGEQFQDRGIAAAYRTRPPYLAEFFTVLEKLHAPAPRKILELGCGTGDATVGLIDQADRIDAVEPSEQMLAIAKQRIPQIEPQRVRWMHCSAETAKLDGPYSLAVAAESLHWMEWSIVLPKIAKALVPGAVLVLAERGGAGQLPWDDQVGHLISKYSTNQEFRRYDLVNELTSRGLFRPIGRHLTAAVEFSQSIDEHIESMHSRNGFSRDGMTPQAAEEFDAAFRQLLQRHCPNGIVRLPVTVTIIWGHPVSPDSHA